MKNKIISVVLAICMLVPLFCLPADALLFRANTKTALNTIQNADSAQDGYANPTITVIVKAFRNYYKFMSLLTGDENYSEDYYNLIVDEAFAGTMNMLAEASGIDFSVVWTRLPETKDISAKFAQVFRLDIPEVQRRIIERETELENEGQALLGGILRIVAIWIGVVEECRLCLEYVDGSDWQMNIVLYVTYRDGRQDVVHSPLFYDTRTSTYTNRDGGPVFMGFYFNAEEGTAWTGKNVWQRNMGYGFLYDLICYCNPFFISFKTQRIKFTYDNKDWMIQLWKGRYFITNGSEVGVYTRPQYAVGSWYGCADESEEMPVSMDLTHNGNTIVSIPKEDAWWLSKFKVDKTSYLPEDMVLTTTITVKDEEMLEAFTDAIYRNKNLYYTVNGLDVTVVW